MITAFAQSRNAEALIAASVQEQPEPHICLRYLLPRHVTFSSQIGKISRGIASSISLKEPPKMIHFPLVIVDLVKNHTVFLQMF